MEFDFLTNIDNNKLRIILEDKDTYQLLDVRTKEEYDAWRIPGFDIQLDYYRFYYAPQMLTVLSKEKPIVVMCNSGQRSVGAAFMLSQLGYKEIYNLTYGIQGWDGEIIQS